MRYYRVEPDFGGLKKVLIIRSARTEQLERAVNFIKARNGGIKIDIISHKIPLPPALSGRIYNFIEYEHRGSFVFFRLMGLMKGVSDKYDGIMILYNNPHGSGYLHLELFSMLVNKGSFIVYDVNDRCYRVVFFNWVLNFIFKWGVIAALLPVLICLRVILKLKAQSSKLKA